MKSIRVTRYISECGRGYWNKSSCLSHELNCKCWKNPKYKTCKTCKFVHYAYNTNGMEHEPQYLETWMELDCKNPLFDYDKHFKPAHEKAQNLNINCPVWESKIKK